MKIHVLCRHNIRFFRNSLLEKGFFFFFERKEIKVIASSFGFPLFPHCFKFKFCFWLFYLLYLFVLFALSIVKIFKEKEPR